GADGGFGKLQDGAVRRRGHGCLAPRVPMPSFASAQRDFARLRRAPVVTPPLALRQPCHGRGGSPRLFGVTARTRAAKFRARMLGVVNEKSLRELGWGQLRAELSARARTPMGRERS